jgi:hypothetical protein
MRAWRPDCRREAESANTVVLIAAAAADLALSSKREVAAKVR